MRKIDFFGIIDIEVIFGTGDIMRINPEKCSGCGLCAEECPVKAVRAGDFGRFIENNCIGCGHCYAVCPSMAVESEYEILPDSAISEILFNRRSVRHFSDREVSRETVEKIIERSCAYPSATNQKCVKITAVTDREILKKIKMDVMANLKNKFRFLDYGIIRFFAKIILGSNYGRVLKYKKLFDSMDEEHDGITFNAPVIVFVHGDRRKIMIDEDAHYVAYNMVLNAAEMGLGTCFMGFVRGYMSRKMKLSLGIGKNHNIYSVFVLGMPDVKFLRPVPQPMTDNNIL